MSALSPLCVRETPQRSPHAQKRRSLGEEGISLRAIHRFEEVKTSRETETQETCQKSEYRETMEICPAHTTLCIEIKHSRSPFISWQKPTTQEKNNAKR